MPYVGGPNIIPQNHSFFKGLLYPSSEESPAHILNCLNDDCLYAILKSTHLLDLCAVASVCTRFHDAASLVFRSRYPKGRFDLRQLRYNGHVTLDQMDDCLRIFGANIKSIEVTFELHEDLILGMIAAHCNNLQELEFNGSNIATATIVAIRTLISQLQSLNLRCLDHRIGELFTSNSQLRSLYVRDNFGVSTLPNVELPKLIELSLIGLNLKQPSFKVFITRNRNIRKLEITDGSIDDNLLQCIPRYLNKLEHLVLNVDCQLDNSISHWDCLKSLRVLELNGKYFPVAAIMRALVDGKIPLERLKLTYSGDDEADYMDYLCRLTSITDLEFAADFTHLNDCQLIRISQTLDNLKQIRVNSKNVTINGVRQMLRYANKLRESFFRLYSGQQQRVCSNQMLNELDCDAIATVIEDRIKMMISMCGTAGQRDYVSGIFSYFFM